MLIPGMLRFGNYDLAVGKENKTSRRRIFDIAVKTLVDKVVFIFKFFNFTDD
jgi:hypothetical protein